METESSLILFLMEDLMELPEGLSVYARLFDQTNALWHSNAELNSVWLRAQENYFNHRLQAEGFVFLNDIYDKLGFERTPAGQLVGWLTNPHKGDGYIDFGLFEARNERFIKGLELTAWLDFNVDGLIFEKIGELDPQTKGALMGDGEETTTTETTTTEVTAPEPSTPAQDVVDEVHTEVQESAPVVEETTTTVTTEETKESD